MFLLMGLRGRGGLVEKRREKGCGGWGGHIERTVVGPHELRGEGCLSSG